MLCTYGRHVLGNGLLMIADDGTQRTSGEASLCCVVCYTVSHQTWRDSDADASQQLFRMVVLIFMECGDYCC